LDEAGGGMKCRQCKSEETKVLESRESKDGLTVRRRRECQNCGYRFTTFERSEELPVYVIKRSGAREPFDRQKLMRSMSVACQKRAVSAKELEDIADYVELAASQKEDREISSQAIGELVLDVLRHLDPVAYVRFASVYRAFSDPEDFLQELQRLAQNSRFNKVGSSLENSDPLL
jgi:transcriptional repressor NrdR